MFPQAYYLIRSKVDGSYLAAYPTLKDNEARSPEHGYILLFQEHFDALSYLNKYGASLVSHFSVEFQSGAQIPGVLNRWGYKGVGIVKDPLLPTVEFLSKA